MNPRIHIADQAFTLLAGTQALAPRRPLDAAMLQSLSDLGSRYRHLTQAAGGGASAQDQRVGWAEERSPTRPCPAPCWASCLSLTYGQFSDRLLAATRPLLPPQHLHHRRGVRPHPAP